MRVCTTGLACSGAPASRCAAAVATAPLRGGAAAAAGATALLVGDSPVTADVLAAAPQLRIVATVTAGTDQVDLDGRPRSRRLGGATCPTPTTEEVAVHALAMMLSLLRAGCPALRPPGARRRLGYVEGRRPARPSGADARHRRAGPDRFAAGGAGARRCSGGCSATTRGVRRRPAGRGAGGARALLSESDVVSLHVPITPADAGLDRGPRPARADAAGRAAGERVARRPGRRAALLEALDARPAGRRRPRRARAGAALR